MLRVSCPYLQENSQGSRATSDMPCSHHYWIKKYARVLGIASTFSCFVSQLIGVEDTERLQFKVPLNYKINGATSVSVTNQILQFTYQ